MFSTEKGRTIPKLYCITNMTVHTIKKFGAKRAQFSKSSKTVRPFDLGNQGRSIGTKGIQI